MDLHAYFKPASGAAYTPRAPAFAIPRPITAAFTHHSPTPTASGPYVLGVDEAGRGPVLGPLVYGVAYCPLAYLDTLGTMGFADSKTLTHETRAALLKKLCSDPSNLGWSVRVLAPQTISEGMLRRPATNLNQQSQDATILLIREVLAFGIEIAELYVDALGPSVPYQAYLTKTFPTIRSITVCPKADNLFKIVGAASVAAKVTRDECVHTWEFEEKNGNWAADKGSGYPSDPKTQAWLRSSIEPTFGYPTLARFSWATVRTALEGGAHAVKWSDTALRTDENQKALTKAFESAQGRDKDRCTLARDIALRSVGDI
ncbi:hypothetical protein BOTBODRAFT_144929 [Botryobasidium botryosum FD-172 SS1]|uniref:Ribonuclease n=1 Tax=Botryobasidium botryosum (strain FD-172 SS1) TaxID=930990 RepID=A0A067MMI0_BOTB1|nr:hypothetical protein BOTBODRAFT_144929 [Botryobasidium botryosum FD-172 SS1]